MREALTTVRISASESASLTFSSVPEKYCSQMWLKMSYTPATVCRIGSEYVNFGFRIEKRGLTRSSKTLPIFIFSAVFVMTEPPFISEPVPAIVSTQPTGTISQVGSS